MSDFRVVPNCMQIPNFMHDYLSLAHRDQLTKSQLSV
jgi:hypothetical protein